MAIGMYRSVDGVTRKLKKRYRSVDGVTKSIKKRYRSVDNVTRLVFLDGLTAKPFSAPSNLTCNYEVANNGSTLRWTITNSYSTNDSAFLRIYREGGFPSSLTIAYTTKQPANFATLIGNENGNVIYIGDYKNAFDYDGSTNGQYIDVESTYDDGTADQWLNLILNVKRNGTFTGEISNLKINGEPVYFEL